MDDSCIFCKIASKEIETDIVFGDVSLPLKGWTDLWLIEIEGGDASRVNGTMFVDNNLNSSGYKVLFNGGYYQHVQHVHWHLLGGKMLIK